MTKYAYAHGRVPSDESVDPVAAEKHKRRHRERDLERGDSRRHHHRRGGAGGNDGDRPRRKRRRRSVPAGAYDTRGHSRHRDGRPRRSRSQSAPPPPPEKRKRRCGPCFCEFCSCY